MFSGIDVNGNTPMVGTSPSDVYVNGVRLIIDEDYEVDAPGSTLTLLTPLTAGSMVQWDLLIPSSQLAPGTVNAFKLDVTPALDGTTQDFDLKYLDPASSTLIPTVIGDGAQIMVSLDGCVQEPGKDFTASGATIHFAQAPPADAVLWIIWYQPGAIAP